LPITLVSVGGGNLPISFDTGIPDMDGGFVDQSGMISSTVGTRSINPTVPYTFPAEYGSFPTSEAIPGTNSIDVFIGGRVDATGVVPSGTYTGSITLSATYN
jgi:hypothetical protein